MRALMAQIAAVLKAPVEKLHFFHKDSETLLNQHQSPDEAHFEIRDTITVAKRQAGTDKLQDYDRNHTFYRSEL